MKQEKEFLKQKLIDFQIKVADLNMVIKEQQRDYESSQKELFLNFLEVLDSFDTLDENFSSKEAGFDKTTRKLMKSVRSIRKKLVRTLKQHHIVQISFDDNRAEMEYCKIVGTKPDRNQENGTILSIVKHGYLNRKTNRVFRKAEVITVLNNEEVKNPT